MTVQTLVWIISLLSIAVVAALFVFVISQSGKVSDVKRDRHTIWVSTRIRASAFTALVIVFGLVSYFTLIHFPIPPQDAPLHAGQVVKVVGHQWYWQMSSHKVHVGIPVEFDVTSADVNHDFVVYDPKGNIVAQVQAMPGYFNKLLHTFRQTGTYTVRCLEYCGLGHTAMEAHFTVVAQSKGE